MNIFLEELTLYVRCEELQALIVLIDSKSIEYSIVENLTFVRIRFSDPEKIVYNINKTVKLLSDNSIPYIELGLSTNRLYAVIDNIYKNKFIKLFEDYEE